MICKKCSGGCASRLTAMTTGNIGCHQLLVDTYMTLKTIKQSVTEQKGSGPVIVLKLGGQFQAGDKPNANGRIYPFEVLKNAIEEIQEDIKARRVMGEFDHPPDAKIHLDRVSHLITGLWLEGKVCYGELEVIQKTPMGAIASALIESKVQLGISSRGVGDMETTIHEGNEYYKVMPGFTLVTFDVVAEPSVQGSYLSIRESREKLLKQLRKTAPKKVREEAEAMLLDEFKKNLRG